MSTGACFCPCLKWGHEPGMCTGQADTSRPLRPSMASHLELPVCGPCAASTAPTHDYPRLAPPGVAHTPDMPVQTAAKVGSVLSVEPTPPRPGDGP